MMKRALTIFALLFAVPAAADEVKRPQLSVEPSSLTFSGAGSDSFKIFNRGNAPLDLRRVEALPGSGFVAIDPGSRTLAPGESVDVKVTYTPDPKKAQAFGGVQVVSNDDTYPSDERDSTSHIAGVALRANASNLLTFMIFFPLVGALIVLLLPAGQEKLMKWVTLGAAAAVMAGAVQLYLGYDRSISVASGNYGLQFVQHLVWIPSFNVEYFVGVDGLSITMVILTALVSLVAVGASWNIEKQLKGYLALFLLLETGMMGTFCAVDFFLFYIFWEIMLLPMYFLIGIWGGPRKEYAAIKFFLYTLAGSVLMLLAIIALYYNSNPTLLVDGTPAKHTFDIMKLAYLNDFTNAP